MPRPMLLAVNGWYPSSRLSCTKEIEKFIDHNIFIDSRNPVSAIVPHAGWYFCGKWAVNCIKILFEKNDRIKNVFVFGGHLSVQSLPILETFDFAETPLGNLANNQDVIEFLKTDKDVHTANFIQDNTIEVLLPIIRYYFGDIKVTAIYLPPNLKTIKLVEKIYDNFHKDSVFIGSTDLTHYGSNYNFYHHDKNITAIDWVRNINDKNYIDLLLSMKGEESMNYANSNKSACSSGAALGAVIIAKKAGIKSGKLIGYSTSYDLHPDESFVGYAGIIY
jgi:MEMO1 family protein